MSFGAAILKPKPPVDRGRRFDCGKYGLLSAKRIAALTGTTTEAVWQRVKAGVTGEALCAPKYEALRGSKGRCTRPAMLVAMKLARAFPDRVPTLAEIRKVHPMGERNAMRWRQAMSEVGQ